MNKFKEKKRERERETQTQILNKKIFFIYFDCIFSIKKLKLKYKIVSYVT
jgi:hypothetical protein